MRYEKNRRIFGLDEYMVIKYSKMLAIPAAIIILIIIILSMDTFSGMKKKNKKKETATQSEIFVPSDEMKEDAVQGVIDMINYYQVARITADTDKLCELFGENPESVSESVKEKLKEESKLFEYFGADTIVYTVDGVRKGEYIVYAKMSLKFKKAETLAPMIMAAYAVPDKDTGRYRILDASDMSTEQKLRMKKINESKEVQKMYVELKEELSKLVVDDVNLADKYKDFVNGSLKFKTPKDTKESVEAKEESKRIAESESASIEESLRNESLEKESEQETSVQEGEESTGEGEGSEAESSAE